MRVRVSQGIGPAATALILSGQQGPNVNPLQQRQWAVQFGEHLYGPFIFCEFSWRSIALSFW